MNIKTLINSQKKEFDTFYSKLLNKHLSQDTLSKAMIYGSMNGGKRIRPFLVSVFSNLAKIKKSQSLRLACAVESIHSYSLIHDDLPSMDNDDFRRGKLSTHKKFNEATAILAGDALHDLAFEILSEKKTHDDADIRIALINKLSKVIGFQGLAGGQSLDLIFENRKIKILDILKMYKMKTAALFNFSCSAPYIIAKKDKNEINFAIRFGNLFGIIFQIIDDILDEKENFNKLGKTPGKDKIQGKSTFLSKLDRNQIIEFSMNEVKNFEKKNKYFLDKNKILNQIIYYNLKKLN